MNRNLYTALNFKLKAIGLALIYLCLESTIFTLKSLHSHEGIAKFPCQAKQIPKLKDKP